MAAVSFGQHTWSGDGVRNAVRAALAADLPQQVTIVKVEYEWSACSRETFWRVRFIMPHMQEAADIEVAVGCNSVFPYEEVLTKIRLFLP